MHYVAAIAECPYYYEFLNESSVVLSNKAAAWLAKVRGTEQMSSDKASVLTMLTRSMFYKSRSIRAVFSQKLRAG